MFWMIATGMLVLLVLFGAQLFGLVWGRVEDWSTQRLLRKREIESRCRKYIRPVLPLDSTIEAKENAGQYILPGKMYEMREDEPIRYSCGTMLAAPANKEKTK